MATTIGGLQGSEELLRQLQELDAQEKRGRTAQVRNAPRQFPSGTGGPSMANVPQVQPKGTFFQGVQRRMANPNPNNFRLTGKPLTWGRGLGAAGTALTAYQVLEPAAAAVGEEIGQNIYDAELQEMYNEPNPFVEQFSREARAAGRPAVSDQRLTGSEAMSRRALPQTQEVAPVDGAALIADDEMPAGTVPAKPTAPPVTVGGFDPNWESQGVGEFAMEPEVEQVPPEMLVEAQGIDPQLKELLDVAMIQQAPLSEPIAQQDLDTRAALTKNRTEYQKPKETLGRKIKRFFVAGSGPIDFTRLDRQERRAWEEENGYTDREKMALATADSNIRAAEGFNRQGRMKDYDTGGQAPIARYMADILAGDRRQDRGFEQALRAGQVGHEQAIERDALSTRRQQLSPEQQRAKAAYETMQSNMLAFSPDTIEQVLGVRPDAAGMKALLDAKGKSDTMEQVMKAQMLEYILERMRSRQPARGQSGTQARPTQSKAPGELAVESLR
jgi:hypothetical protein